MSAQTAADLRAAADVLEWDGWTQEEYVGPNGCRCIVGAVTKVLGGDDGEMSVPVANKERLFAARRLVATQIGDARTDYWFDVIDWNDEPGRTADEVIVALRAAADRAEAES